MSIATSPAYDVESARPRIVRTVVGFVLVAQAVRWMFDATLPALDGPPVRLLGYNFTAWALRAAGVEDALLGGGWSGPAAWWAMMVLGVAALVRPKARMLLALFWLLFFADAVLFNVGAAMSDQSRVPLIVMLIPLWAAPAGRFSDWWAAARYFVCWIFVLAFLQKIARGSFWVWEEGARTMEANFALILYEKPDWLWSRAIAWCLQHPIVPNLGHKVFSLLEAAFVVGFFTYRFDAALRWAALAVVGMTILFGDTGYWEMAIIAAVFGPAPPGKGGKR